MPIKIIFTLLFLVQYQLAIGQVYKCKNTKGDIVYSESRCPSNTVGSQIIIEPNVMDSTELRNQIVKSSNQSSVTSIIRTETNTIESAESMSVYKKDTRMRELTIALNDGATSEKRTDASNELRYLKDRNPRELSYELEQQRRNLKIELTDFEVQKRAKALSKLASLYTNY